jgi:hypothetical protein
MTLTTDERTSEYTKKDFSYECYITYWKLKKGKKIKGALKRTSLYYMSTNGALLKA